MRLAGCMQLERVFIMKTVRTIKVGYTTLALPEGMAHKDIVQLAGYLASLRTVNTHYLHAAEPHREVHFTDADGPSVCVGEREILSRAEATEAYEADKLARAA